MTESQGSSSSEDDSVHSLDSIDEDNNIKSRQTSSTTRNNGKKFAVEEEDEFSDGYGPDLMGDAEDRKKLSSMTEVEREAVLYERAQARLAKTERKELEKKMRELESGGSGISRPTRGPSADTEKKRKTLEALKAKREKRRRKSDDSDYYEDEEEGEVKRKGKSKEPSFSDEESLYSEDEHSLKKKRGEVHSQLKKNNSSATELIDFDMANKLRISRNSIAKWIFHPEFDEACRGCLLRLSIGFKGDQQIYRLVEIKKIVKYHKNYKINDVTTNKAAIVKYGRSEKTFSLDFVSNSDFTTNEFDRWLETMREEHQPIITRKSAQIRQETWNELEVKPVSNDIVSAMVAAKRELGSAHRNLIAERTMLLHLREEAVHNENNEEIDRIDEELNQLAKEQAAQPPRLANDTRLEALAELNRRNRQLNISKAREAEKSFLQHKKEVSGRLDPFSRRKCQPSSFSFDIVNTGDSRIIENTPSGAIATEIIDIKSQESQKAHGFLTSPTSTPTDDHPEDTTNTPVDLYAAHNVDIDIDI